MTVLNWRLAARKRGGNLLKIRSIGGLWTLMLHPSEVTAVVRQESCYFLKDRWGWCIGRHAPQMSFFLVSNLDILHIPQLVQ